MKEIINHTDAGAFTHMQQQKCTDLLCAIENSASICIVLSH